MNSVPWGHRISEIHRGSRDVHLDSGWVDFMFVWMIKCTSRSIVGNVVGAIESIDIYILCLLVWIL